MSNAIAHLGSVMCVNASLVANQQRIQFGLDLRDAVIGHAARADTSIHCRLYILLQAERSDKDV